MKFIKLRSFGGDCHVMAGNITYLREDESGQTKVGLVGGDSFLVKESVEQILSSIICDEGS